MSDSASVSFPEPSPSSAQALLDILTRPLPALVRAVRIPASGWWPYLVLVLGSLVATGLYFHEVDLHWVMANILARVPANARAHAAREFTPTIFTVSTLVGTFLATSVGLVIVGAYYYMMLSLGGRDTRFFSMLSLAAWVSFPAVLGILAAIALVLVSGPHTGPSVLNPTALAYLLHLRPGERYYDAASTLTILMPWSWALATLAFVRIYRYRLDRALAIVLVPYIIYYALLLWL